MLICDSEADNLVPEATTVWVICAYNIATEEWVFSFDDSVLAQFRGSLDQWIGEEVGEHFEYFDHFTMFEYLNTESVCFHNLFQYDKQLFKKLYPGEFKPAEEHDSYILSQLFNPDRGKHGLAAWGERFGVPKPLHEDWSQFSREMLHRVVEDVKINTLTWYALMKEKKAWEDLGQSWDKAIKIEYGIAELQGRQEQHGVLFDVDKGTDLAIEIYTEIQKIDTFLLEKMPLRVVPGVEVSKPFKKDGSITEIVRRWFDV